MTRFSDSKDSIKHKDYTTSSNYKGTFRILSIERDRWEPNEFKMKAEFEFTTADSDGHTVKITHVQFDDRVRP